MSKKIIFMKKEIKICLLWHNLHSSNLGVAALTYQQLFFLDNFFSSKNINVKYFIAGTKSFKKLDYKEFNLNQKINFITIARKNFLSILIKRIYFDYIFDIGEGDSFSDIYGLKHFFYIFFGKFLFKTNNFILSPQKYGPYKSLFAKFLALKFLKNKKFIFTRDYNSYVLLKNNNIKSILTPDIAFYLPFKRLRRNIRYIGINISGLIWNNIYNLTDSGNYKKIILESIDFFIKNNKKVFLISHVNSVKKNTLLDDDYHICKIIKTEYYPNNKNVEVVDEFQNPIAAKTFCTKLNFVIASRMHFCIASISSNTPTIALAYSSKYSGVFKVINFKYYFNLFKQPNKYKFDIKNLYITRFNDIKLNVKNANNKLVNIKNIYKSNLDIIFYDIYK